MAKIITAIIFTLALSACSGAKTVTEIRSVVQEVNIPILFVPAPPKLDRPPLPIHELTTEELKDSGVVVKYYKATVQVLVDYSDQLETIVASYQTAHEQSEKIREQIEKMQKDKAKDTK